MSRLLILGLSVAVAVGCGPSKRKHGDVDDAADKPQDAAGQREKPGAGNPDLGTKRPGGGVGTAVQRAVNLHEMRTIQQLIQTYELDFGRMPSKQEVEQSLQRDAPKTSE